MSFYRRILAKNANTHGTSILHTLESICYAANVQIVSWAVSRSGFWPFWFGIADINICAPSSEVYERCLKAINHQWFSVQVFNIADFGKPMLPQKTNANEIVPLIDYAAMAELADAPCLDRGG